MAEEESKVGVTSDGGNEDEEGTTNSDWLFVSGVVANTSADWLQGPWAVVAGVADWLFAPLAWKNEDEKEDEKFLSLIVVVGLGPKTPVD